MLLGNESDGIKTYLNETQIGLDAIDTNSFNQLKLELLEAWIDLAKENGLEPAILLFKYESLRQILLPELNSWDELVDRLDTRHCTRTFTLVNIFRWFLWLQLACFTACLIPGLVMFCQQCIVCKTVWKKNRLFLIIDRPKKPDKEEYKKDKRESQTSLKQAYTVLHVKNIESEWLPDRFRSMLKKEDKKTRLNREMINEFRRKLLASHELFQKTMTQMVKPGFLIEENQRPGQKWTDGLKKWVRTLTCLKKLNGNDDTFNENRAKKNKNWIKLARRKKIVLRKVESAIFAHEYEKERGTVNQHLVPSEDRSKSDLYETQSMWDMHK